jgi:pimeloyl-ACP methyl ester carboxylesterase
MTSRVRKRPTPGESSSPRRREPLLVSVQSKGRVDEYERLEIATARGPVEARLYEGPGRTAALLVGGVGGGFDSPAADLYGRLGSHLRERGIATLRVRYRNSTDLEGSVHDVLAGVQVLAERGKSAIGLVGHSFGGAAVIGAATRAPQVTTVVTLATQAYGTDAVDTLAPRPLLLIHGLADEVLPPGCSRLTFRRAKDPKELRLLEGAGHVLDEAAEEVFGTVAEWLRTKLLHEEAGSGLPG